MEFFSNPLHLTLLIIVIVLLFGASKLGDVGGALGKSIREFKKEATKDEEQRAATTPPPTAGYVPPPTQSYSQQQPVAPPTANTAPFAPAGEPPRPASYMPTDYRPNGAAVPPATGSSTSAPPEYTGR